MYMGATLSRLRLENKWMLNRNSYAIKIQATHVIL